MRKAIAILMLLFLGVGLTQPGGCLQAFNLHERYHHCSLEDHDITPLDFVFEHLLNLESIVNFIEGEQDYLPGDHPHNPAQAAQSAAQVAVVMPGAIKFEINEHPVFPEVIKHCAGKGVVYLSSFQTDIFRPPVRC